MVASSFPKALAFTLKEEGGNVDNPRDPGGRTSRGITQRTYDAYCRHLGLPLCDVYKATNMQVGAIYRAMYWEPWAEWWPIGIDLVYFDFAVNAGPHRAVLELQEASDVKPDGVVGPLTIEAVLKAPVTELVRHYTNQRKSFYESLHEGLFLHDWLGRADRAQAAALAMIGESNADKV